MPEILLFYLLQGCLGAVFLFLFAVLFWHVCLLLEKRGFVLVTVFISSCKEKEKFIFSSFSSLHLYKNSSSYFGQSFKTYIKIENIIL